MIPPSLDRDGYLKVLDDWTPAVAEWLAEQSGIELSASHWQIIEAAREFYARTDVSPEMRPLVKLAKATVGDEVGSSMYLMKLFPGSPAKLVSKIAGLPRPANCL